jgi:hypothetical protein
VGANDAEIPINCCGSAADESPRLGVVFGHLERCVVQICDHNLESLYLFWLCTKLFVCVDSVVAYLSAYLSVVIRQNTSYKHPETVRK